MLNHGLKGKGIAVNISEKIGFHGKTSLRLSAVLLLK
jgi:hypothetical protein